MAVTYRSYLRLDELLNLQTPLSDGPEHDELLFIVIHQVYELWFKQLLHELKEVQRQLDQGNLYPALDRLKRMLTILKTAVGQVDVLETMTPLQFNSFRGRLETSSGFQSLQFREFEFRLGHRSPQLAARYPEGSVERTLLEGLLKERTLYDSFLRYLSLQGVAVPAELLSRDITQPNPEHAGFRACLIDIYRTRPEIASLCERLVDLDEGIQEWRYRHVKMVERTIGRKMGTGGSPGVDYLKATLFNSLFKDFWAVRSEF